MPVSAADFLEVRDSDRFNGSVVRSVIATDADRLAIAALRRRDAIASARDADLAYAVGRFDAALDANERATRRIALAVAQWLVEHPRSGASGPREAQG